MTTEMLAHSRRRGIAAQPYRRHVENVLAQAERNAQGAMAFCTGDRDAFVGYVKIAALYHDLGKLDQANQDVLCIQSRDPLPVPHEDAGVAELLRLERKESAVLVAAHHAGLFSKSQERCPNKKRLFRNERQLEGLNGQAVADYVDRRLDEYRQKHGTAGCPEPPENAGGPLHRCGFTRRVTLSCLVDADHGDTARHYGREVEAAVPKTQWAERAAALERYMETLPLGETERERQRNSLRQQVYEVCRYAEIDSSIRACDAPVGSGKTTAVMAHLLRVAQAKGLRHIFVVLPYTNIIKQSVEVYRRALVLERERPEDVVAEHHHQADFADIGLRQLATLWKAPIIVTTAVQFFETLASHHPAKLRKLHELPGSAVFVDEAHAAIPSHLWPQVWRWLETWTRNWGGHLILASGSLPRFWELDEYVEVIKTNSDEPMSPVPDLVSEKRRRELERAERQRLHCRRQNEQDKALSCDELIEFAMEKPGPRLLIVNTVQTAAVVADQMRKSGHDVLHLSTALAPIHRELIVEQVKGRLANEKDQEWTLVATSCVEAGMDLSFRTGLRESASTASLIQIGGRVSRGSEYEDAEVWDLRLLDDRFRSNPAYEISQRVLDGFTLDELNNLPPSELAKCAMRREWTAGAEGKAKALLKAESDMEYPTVTEECRVISDDTRTVVIDHEIAKAIRRGQRINPIRLLRHSVQIWSRRVEKLRLEPLFPHVAHDGDDRHTLYVWTNIYDPDFLGYMAGVLQIERFLSEGGAII